MSISCHFQTLYVYLVVEINILRFILSTLIVFPSFPVLCTYQIKSVLGGDEEGKVELFFNGYNNQHIRENAENYKGEMLTQPLKKNNMIYQGMYEYHKTVNESTKFK